MKEHIIDSHMHFLPRARQRGIITWLKSYFPDHPVPADISHKNMLTERKANNIDQFLNLVFPLHDRETSSLNAWNLKFCSETPGAVPVCSLHIDTDNKAAVAEKAKEAGSLGIKLHPFAQRFDPLDRVFEELYMSLNEMAMPLFIHTGYDDWYGASFPPEDIKKIISSYPDMPVVLVHMIFPHVDRARQLMEDYPNVFCDATNVPGSIPLARKAAPSLATKIQHDFIECIEAFHERIMFGSDYPVGLGSLKHIYNDFHRSGFCENVKASLLGKTAKHFIEKYSNHK